VWRGVCAAARWLEPETKSRGRYPAMINGWPRAAFRPDPQTVPGPERFLGRQRHGGAPRGGVPVLRGTPTPRKRGGAPYQRDIKGKYASRRSAGPLIFGAA